QTCSWWFPSEGAFRQRFRRLFRVKAIVTISNVWKVRRVDTLIGHAWTFCVPRSATLFTG
ncbi:MAG: hypothetical protein VXZ53_04980, partial [Planctomycetota bacterium]|nr:hypothetical protein [Planctomycetota bacterium]